MLVASVVPDDHVLSVYALRIQLLIDVNRICGKPPGRPTIVWLVEVVPKHPVIGDSPAVCLAVCNVVPNNIASP
jgi:hypothetical protein